MTIQIIIDNILVPYKKVAFSDGGSNIKLEVPEVLIGYRPSAYYSISVDPTTKVDDYFWEIHQAVNAIEQTFGTGFNEKYLHLSYLPHGRADRVFEYGNGFPLQLFFSNMCLMFDTIFLTDPHSDYYKEFQGSDVEFEVTPQHRCFIEVVGNDIKSGDVLIAPDKGSLKKIYKLQQALDNRTIATFVVEAGKKRDIATGKIVETTLPDFDFNGKTVWIVDDLGDGLGTFTPLAEKLKVSGAKQVNLYVTHLIASKGLDILKGKINNVYAYQTVGNYVNRIDIDNFNKGVI